MPLGTTDNDEVNSTRKNSIDSNRRNIFNLCLVAVTTLVVDSGEVSATIIANEQVSSAGKVFKAGEVLGKDDALARFKLGRKDLMYLLENYDKITLEGGDGIRRYLGTVGVTSGLYGITKVMKELQEEADDFVEYTESMNTFDSYLRAADTACYSANFVEFSAAKTKPEKFFDDAKQDARNMMIEMDKMAVLLKVE